MLDKESGDSKVLALEINSGVKTAFDCSGDCKLGSQIKITSRESMS